MTATPHYENGVQTIARWIAGFFKVAVVICALALLAGILIGAVAAIGYMILAVVQSVNARKNSEHPLISDRFFYLYFYMLALPITFALFVGAAAHGPDVMEYAGYAYRIVLMVTVYLLLRYQVLTLLMRDTEAGLQNMVAWVLAILAWPVYAYPLYKLGVPMMIYGLAEDTANLF